MARRTAADTTNRDEHERESLQPGTTAAHVAKKHGVALNVLYYWRKVYRDLVDTELSGVAPDEDAPSSP